MPIDKQQLETLAQQQAQTLSVDLQQQLQHRRRSVLEQEKPVSLWSTWSMQGFAAIAATFLMVSISQDMLMPQATPSYFSTAELGLIEQSAELSEDEFLLLTREEDIHFYQWLTIKDAEHD